MLRTLERIPSQIWLVSCIVTLIMSFLFIGIGTILWSEWIREDFYYKFGVGRWIMFLLSLMSLWSSSAFLRCWWLSGPESEEAKLRKELRIAELTAAINEAKGKSAQV